MSDSEASCACLTVKYLTQPGERRGEVSGWWCCTSCGNKFIPWGAHRFLRDEAVRDALNGVCVKKPEAETMSGELEGAVLEQALKSDVKAKELGDPGTRHTGPRPTHPEFLPPDPAVAKVLSDGLLRDAENARLTARHKFVEQSSPTEGDLQAPSAATIKAEVDERLGDMKVPLRVVIPALVQARAAGAAEKPPTNDLPSGVKMAMWMPLPQADGTTIFQCSVDGFGLRATASSRSKQKALAYCLEDLARQMIEADHG